MTRVLYIASVALGAAFWLWLLRGTAWGGWSTP